MKFVSFRHAGRNSFGVVTSNDLIADLGDTQGGSLKAFLSSGGKANPDLLAVAPRLPFSETVFLPVIPDADLIFCVGHNYAKHVAEMGRETPKHPAIFSRNARSQIGHGAPIIRPSVSTHLDYEGELAVVIGRPGRHIPAGKALDHVAGYSCYNDGSIRDWQRHTTQFLPGKNFRGTGAFGPWMVTPDEADGIMSAPITTRLNGAVMQASSIDDLIFDIPTLIAYISTFTDLAAGDVIVTGTPGGVGVARKPPVFMKPGDVVEVEIGGVGILRNTVADEAEADGYGGTPAGGRGS